MLKEYAPSTYLSKREDNTYCIIHKGMPLNQYTTKEDCIRVAGIFAVCIADEVWSAEHGSFIEE